VGSFPEINNGKTDLTVFENSQYKTTYGGFGTLAKYGVRIFQTWGSFLLV